MNKKRIRINLDVSEELGKKIKEQANKEDKSVNAFIREVLAKYFSKEVAE